MQGKFAKPKQKDRFTIGNHMVFKTVNSARRPLIFSVEVIRTSNPSVNTGLLIAGVSDTEIDELADWAPNNQAGKIVDFSEKN